jgi:fatty acid desaturase
MGAKLLTFLGLGALVLMILGLVVIQHNSTHTESTSNFHEVICNAWVGALCLTAGWLFSSAYSNYDEVEWPKWPFVKAYEY